MNEETVTGSLQDLVNTFGALLKNRNDQELGKIATNISDDALKGYGRLWSCLFNLCSLSKGAAQQQDS